MARFTMTIQDIYMMYIWEDNAQLPDYLPATVMSYGTSKLFNFPYDVPVDRATFEDAFNKRYYLKEIGFETVDIFQMKLDYTLNINLEKYKMLYNQLLTSWQMRNQNSTTVNTTTSNQATLQDQGSHTKTNTQTITGNSNATGNDRITGNQQGSNNTSSDTNTREQNNVNQSQIFSDTPDNRLNNLTINPNNDRFSLNYASTLQDNLSRQTMTNTGRTVGVGQTSQVSTQDQRTQANTNTSQNANEQTSGSNQLTRTQRDAGSIDQTTVFQYNSDITTYRQFLEVYRPILEMILDDLEPLFMGVF